MDARVIALIVAAGRGLRAGGETPKQYHPLGNRSVLAWSLGVFLAHPGVDGVRVIIHADDEDAYHAAIGSHRAHPQLMPPIHGGDTRQASVRLGLESLRRAPPDRVLIHDAARPFVTPAVIDRVLAATTPSTGAIAALPVADTLKRAAGSSSRDDAAPQIDTTIPRDQIWRAQTPQGFPFALIDQAHAAARHQTLTDDAAVAERVGATVSLVLGSPDNMKITVAEDFGLAASLLARARAHEDHPLSAGRDQEGPIMEYRTGQGFDVHAFEDGDHVTLCGVRVPHTRTLKGHSDADVGLHALTDAVFGALSEGDIGAHFPPSDPQWRGAASEIFLARARDRVTQRGGRIVHVDVTLICERPKIGPHRDAMRHEVAKILRIPIDRVSVKATTTERLGFPGRGEGIAALASATLAMPAVE